MINSVKANCTKFFIMHYVWKYLVVGFKMMTSSRSDCGKM